MPNSFVFLLIVGIIIVIFGGYWIYTIFFPEENVVFCALEVRQCPDGTYVSRMPPTCEYAACPRTEAPPEIGEHPDNSIVVLDISDWNTYRNPKYKLELKYPPSWKEGSELDAREELNVDFSHNQIIGDVVDTYAEFNVSARIMSQTFIDFWNQNLVAQSGELREIDGIKALIQIDEREPGSKFEQKRYALVSGNTYYVITTRIWDENEYIVKQDIDYPTILENILLNLRFIK